MKKFEDLLLVVNPQAGKKTIKNHLLGVVEVLSNAGFSVTVYPTKSRGDAEKTVFELANKFSTVVCCGGDGTLNEVINGLLLGGSNAKLGYIACGTLNEWSQGLGVSKNIISAAKDITANNLIKLDVGNFAGKYFSYTTSFGAFTEASYSAPQDVKNVLGQAAYIIEGIKSLGNIRPIPLTLSCEEKTVSGEFLFGAVSNSMSVGGIVKFNQTAVTLNDGKLEVFLIRHPKNTAELQSIISSILTRDFNNNCIEFFHTSSIKVEGANGLCWTLDGEKAVSGENLVINNVHNAISFYAPKKFEMRNIECSQEI